MMETSFFADQFKQIQTAWEVLRDEKKRRNYDQTLKQNEPASSSKGSNFLPEIEYFKTNVSEIHSGDIVNFSWKCINADKVVVQPFGVVQPIGTKSWKIENWKDPRLKFKITATNSIIDRSVHQGLSLTNLTFYDMKKYFGEIILKERKARMEKESQSRFNPPNKKKQLFADSERISYWIILIFTVIVTFLIWLAARR